MAKKILVVDDSATVRQQLNLTLTSAGYAVEEARDGKEGLDKISAAKDLSIVICDVNMPRMNGIEMLKNVKSQGLSVPVIMLTTEGQPALIRQAREEGAKGWMVKPFNPDLLLKAVEKLAA